MTTQSEDPNERVDHPRHYNQHPSKVETIDLIENLPCNLANAVKYLWRCGLKTTETPLRDLMSARWYTERERQRIRMYELENEPVPKTEIVWRAIAHRVIEAGDGGVLSGYLANLLTGDFDDMLEVIDYAIDNLKRESGDGA